MSYPQPRLRFATHSVDRPRVGRTRAEHGALGDPTGPARRRHAGSVYGVTADTLALSALTTHSSSLELLGFGSVLECLSRTMLQL